MKKIAKKILPLALAMLMVFSMLSAIAFTASAAPAPVQIGKNAISSAFDDPSVNLTALLATSSYDSNKRGEFTYVVSPSNPGWIIIDLGANYTISYFEVDSITTPDQNGDRGYTKEFSFSVAAKGAASVWDNPADVAWSPVDSVTGNTSNTATVSVPEGTVDAQYVLYQLTDSSPWWGKSVTGAIRVFGVLNDTVAATGISSIKGISSTLAVGNSGTAKASVLPAEATNKNVVYTSSDSTVISIDSSTGVWNAIKAGSAAITAKTVDGNFTASPVNVTVYTAFTHLPVQNYYVGSSGSGSSLNPGGDITIENRDGDAFGGHWGEAYVIYDFGEGNSVDIGLYSAVFNYGIPSSFSLSGSNDPAVNAGSTPNQPGDTVSGNDRGDKNHSSWVPLSSVGDTSDLPTGNSSDGWRSTITTGTDNPGNYRFILYKFNSGGPVLCSLSIYSRVLPETPFAATDLDIKVTTDTTPNLTAAFKKVNAGEMYQLWAQAKIDDITGNTSTSWELVSGYGDPKTKDDPITIGVASDYLLDDTTYNVMVIVQDRASGDISKFVKSVTWESEAAADILKITGVEYNGAEITGMVPVDVSATGSLKITASIDGTLISVNGYATADGVYTLPAFTEGEKIFNITAINGGQTATKTVVFKATDSTRTYYEFDDAVTASVDPSGLATVTIPTINSSTHTFGITGLLGNTIGTTSFNLAANYGIYSADRKSTCLNSSH